MSFVEFEFLIDGAPRKFGLERRGRTLLFREEETVLEAEVRRISGNEFLFELGGRTVRVYLARDGDRTLVSAGGREFVITEARPETVRSFGAGEITPEGSIRVKSPMPGRVIKLSVQEGEAVKRNQALAVVEAMKMQNEIQSPVEGIVKKVHVAVGELVDSEKPLIEIESKN